jgi:hypothetical protein
MPSSDFLMHGRHINNSKFKIALTAGYAVSAAMPARALQNSKLCLCANSTTDSGTAGVKLDNIPAGIVWFKDKLLPKSVLAVID